MKAIDHDLCPEDWLTLRDAFAWIGQGLIPFIAFAFVLLVLDLTIITVLQPVGVLLLSGFLVLAGFVGIWAWANTTFYIEPEYHIYCGILLSSAAIFSGYLAFFKALVVLIDTDISLLLLTKDCFLIIFILLIQLFLRKDEKNKSFALVTAILSLITLGLQEVFQLSLLQQYLLEIFIKLLEIFLSLFA
ncbi:MAG: hypothetical protein ACFFBD_00475 [Candidatus Hodarchaeota archaeon]